MKLLQWTDDVLQMCSTVEESPAIMSLLEQLSQGSADLRLLDMRDSVALGNYSRAASLEAEARAWESMPVLIKELAHIWRERTKG